MKIISSRFNGAKNYIVGKLAIAYKIANPSLQLNYEFAGGNDDGEEEIENISLEKALELKNNEFPSGYCSLYLAGGQELTPIVSEHDGSIFTCPVCITQTTIIPTTLHIGCLIYCPYCFSYHEIIDVDKNEYLTLFFTKQSK